MLSHHFAARRVVEDDVSRRPPWLGSGKKGTVRRERTIPGVQVRVVNRELLLAGLDFPEDQAAGVIGSFDEGSGGQEAPVAGKFHAAHFLFFEPERPDEGTRPGIVEVDGMKV